MEARTLAKVNQLKSDEIARDIDAFLARGGKIEVIEHKTDADRLESVKRATASGYSNAQQRSKKKAAKQEDPIDDEDGLDNEPQAPSTATPTEQLETPIE